jgi:hypothetical protein
VNSSIYDIDYNKLAQWLLPPALRKDKTIGWLAALIRPVVWLYQVFLRYRKQKLYELTITPQVCYLERLLNDKYDYTQRRIRIVDAIDHTPLFIFQTAELKPVYLGAKYIFTDSEAGDIQDDFVIKVPKDITFQDAEMISLVKQYKLAATKFKIQKV